MTNKLTKFIKQYFVAISILLLFGGLLKIVETVYSIQLGEEITIYRFLKSSLSLAIAYCFYSVLLFPIYVIFNFINKLIARIIISIVFSLLIVLEIGLTIYLFKTGSLMGVELLLRPVSEVIATIETVVTICVPILSILIAAIVFYLLLFFADKKMRNGKIILTLAVVVSATSIFITWTPKLQNSTANPTLKKYIQCKSLYCFRSIKEHFLSEEKYCEVIYDERKINEFIQENWGKSVINNLYPLERTYENNNVLAPYFKSDSLKPNIVIFIFESLGREWNSPNPNALSFTPFLDSLANTGLYWKNCLSTTRRSFGVVPSITGSLPFGIKGFQFGNMPEHNSLVKILKKNNYKTNAFYAGAFYFDAINDYLLAQDIDYMSENFYIDYETNKTAYNGFPYWGYHDSIMYAKTLQDKNFQNGTAPYFNLFVTTSAHQSADKNNPFFERAYQSVMEIIRSAPKEKQEYYLKNIHRAVSIFYQDLCLKDFFENYKKRNDFENTIFIFTGDHASGMMQKNDLSIFHVPLVIWSPLLLKHQQFLSLVSHNDVVPTIESLLKENYNLQSTENVHWLGNQLDTSSVFNSNLKTILFDYSNGYKEIVFNNYYYNEQLFEIQNENLDLQEVQNDSLKAFMQHKLNLYKYIHKYVYLDNKLTNYPLFPKTKYETIKDIFIGTVSIPFNTASRWRSLTLYPETKIEGKWEKIKVSITADILFLEIPENQDYYELMIECNGKNIKNASNYTDKINKYIMVEDFEAKKWYPLQVEKQFLMGGVSDISVKLFFWIGSDRPNNYSKLKNVRVLIEGIK